MIEDVLLISNDEQVINNFKDKIALLRINDKIRSSSYYDYKRSVINNHIFILHYDENMGACIEYINKKTSNPIIIILLQCVNSNIAENTNKYDIFDYIYLDENQQVITNKLKKCSKYLTIQDRLNTFTTILNEEGVINYRTGLFKLKYIKEHFDTLRENKSIQNGVLAIIEIEENVKTKISNNRLALTIKKKMRTSDICAEYKSGIYYIIIKDININDAKKIILDIQNNLGTELPIKAGLTKIGIQEFIDIEKNAQDSLMSAKNSGDISSSITDNFENSEAWLEDDKISEKKYKIFQNLYIHKLKNIIEPVFYKFQKEIELKLKNIKVIQYANLVECVFSINRENKHSELTIHYDGFTKLYIEIHHKGLNSFDNSKEEISLKKLNEKDITKLIKKLKLEFIKNESEN